MQVIWNARGLWKQRIGVFGLGIELRFIPESEVCHQLAEEPHLILCKESNFRLRAGVDQVCRVCRRYRLTKPSRTSSDIIIQRSDRDTADRAAFIVVSRLNVRFLLLPDAVHVHV